MSSPFLRGLQTGVQLGGTMKAGERQDKLDARSDEEYAKKKAAEESYTQLQKDYYTNQGAFAPQASADPMAQQKADASYGQAETRRFGLDVAQPLPTTQGPAGGLSLTPQESQSLQPKPLDPSTKDKLYYSKLNEWAGANLAPEKALAFRKESEQLQEMDYNRQRLNAFRDIASGKKEGWDYISNFYNNNLPDGWDLDTSQVQMTPDGWAGLQRVERATGKVQPIKTDNATMATMFMASDPAQFLTTKIKLAEAARADRTEQRLDDATKAQIRQGDQKWALDVAQFAETVANNKRLNQYRMGSLSLEEQGLQLRQEQFKNDETAKDLLNRQSLFINNFGAGRKLKPPGELASPEEKAKFAAEEATLATRQQFAALSTSLYGLSSEGVPAGQRSAVAAEVEQFVRGVDAGTLDRSKIKPGADGMATFGRVKFPASLIPPEEPAKAGAPAAGAKPARKAGLQTPGATPAPQTATPVDPAVRAASLRAQLEADDRIKTPGLSGLGGRAVREGAMPLGALERQRLEQELASLTK